MVVCEVLVAACSATSTASTTTLAVSSTWLPAASSTFTVAKEMWLLPVVVNICNSCCRFELWPGCLSSSSLPSSFSPFSSTITGSAGTPTPTTASSTPCRRVLSNCCCSSTSSTSSASSSTLSTGSSLIFLVFSIVLLITDSKAETLSSNRSAGEDVAGTITD